MEAYLDRKLDSSELVHHKNGNRRDNRLENLQVMSRSEHQKWHMDYEKANGIRRKLGPKPGWRKRLSRQLPN